VHHAEVTSRGLFHAIELQKFPVDYLMHEERVDLISYTLSRCVDREMKVVAGYRVRFNPL
jgi:hypothetical protein